MREISLHILDIAQNSLTAGAAKVEITIKADTVKDIMSVTISDDGKGIDTEELKRIESPF